MANNGFDVTHTCCHQSHNNRVALTCEAIDEPRKSSKAIDKRVIINFRNKNVVIAHFRDKNEVFVLFIIYILIYILFTYIYIYIFILTTRFKSSLYLPYWQFHMAVTTISRNTKVNEQKQQESQKVLTCCTYSGSHAASDF